MEQLLRQVVLIIVIRQLIRSLATGRINLIKFSRNVVLLVFSLCGSVLIGWLLIEEEARQRERAVGGPTSRWQPQAADDLTLIDGIGERYANALAEIGITSFAALAAQDPVELSRRMESRVSAERIRRDDWIGQARQLSAGAT